MTYIERGLYRELLDECWVEGFISNDFEKLAEICGCPKQVLVWAWPVLNACFKKVGPDLLINPRINRERTAKDAERVQKALAGARGGLARAMSGNEIAAENCEAEPTNPVVSASDSEASAKQVPYSRAEQEHKQQQSRAEAEHAARAAGPPTSSRSFNSTEAARYVLTELNLAGRDMLVLIRDVIENEVQQSPKTTPEMVAEQLVRDRRSYEDAARGNKFKWPPKQFFAQGIFKHPENWKEPTNAGSKPRAKRTEVNANSLEEVKKWNNSRFSGGGTA